MCLCAHMLHAAAEAGLGLWSGRQAGFRVRAVSRAVRDRGGAGAGAEIERGGEGGWVAPYQPFPRFPFQAQGRAPFPRFGRRRRPRFPVSAAEGGRNFPRFPVSAAEGGRNFPLFPVLGLAGTPVSPFRPSGQKRLIGGELGRRGRVFE